MIQIKRAIETAQEKEVSRYIETLGVGYKASNTGLGITRDNWECDSWICSFDRLDNHKRKAASFNYYTGLGHRIKKHGLESVSLPNPASVLYSLILDSSALHDSFQNWCDNYGYDEDSIKAFNTYQDCTKNAKKLLSIFSRAELEHINTLLEDY